MSTNLEEVPSVATHGPVDFKGRAKSPVDFKDASVRRNEGHSPISAGPTIAEAPQKVQQIVDLLAAGPKNQYPKCTFPKISLLVP